MKILRTCGDSRPAADGEEVATDSGLLFRQEAVNGADLRRARAVAPLKRISQLQLEEELSRPH